MRKSNISNLMIDEKECDETDIQGLRPNIVLPPPVFRGTSPLLPRNSKEQKARKHDSERELSSPEADRQSNQIFRDS